MFEKQNLPLLPIRAFLRKILVNLAIAVLIIAISLSIGMLGYAHYESMNWVDAYVNASMILSGMGPVSTLQTNSGKIFAGSYALFSGIIFLFVMAIIFAPLFHRFLHKFLLKDKK